MVLKLIVFDGNKKHEHIVEHERRFEQIIKNLKLDEENDSVVCEIQHGKHQKTEKWCALNKDDLLRFYNDFSSGWLMKVAIIIVVRGFTEEEVLELNRNGISKNPMEQMGESMIRISASMPVLEKPIQKSSILNGFINKHIKPAGDQLKISKPPIFTKLKQNFIENTKQQCYKNNPIKTMPPIPVTTEKRVSHLQRINSSQVPSKSKFKMLSCQKNGFLKKQAPLQPKNNQQQQYSKSPYD